MFFVEMNGKSKLDCLNVYKFTYISIWYFRVVDFHRIYTSNAVDALYMS